MSSILRRLVSRNINQSRKFSSSAVAVNRELLVPSSPWLMLPPSFVAGGVGGNMVYNLYSPIKDKVVSFNNRGGKHETHLIRDEHTRLVGSSHGWLAFFNSRSLDLFLSNPLSGRRILLPPFAGKPFRDDEDVSCWPYKVIISSSPNDEDCRAVMILGDRAASCRPGPSTEWAPLGQWQDDPISVISLNNFRLYTDFVYSAATRKFSAFLHSDFSLQELEGWDIADPAHPRPVQLDRLGELPNSELCITGTYIVSGPDDDQLFVVKRSFINHDVKVYRIKEGKLELCSSLDDLVMFVGTNHSFTINASKTKSLVGLKPNSIYFSETRNPFVGQAIDVFDYEEKSCSPVYYPSLQHRDLLPLRPKDLIPQPWFTPTFD